MHCDGPQWPIGIPVWYLSDKKKEKERKEVYLYSALFVATTLKALRRGSHSFTCKQHHACLSFMAFTRCRHHSNCGSRHPIAAHYSFIDPERMKGWVGLVEVWFQAEWRSASMAWHIVPYHPTSSTAVSFLVASTASLCSIFSVLTFSV